MNEKNYYLCFVCVRANRCGPCGKIYKRNVQLICPTTKEAIRIYGIDRKVYQDRSVWLKVNKTAYEFYTNQYIE